VLKRNLEKNIHHFLFKKRAIIIYGPRQVGKTTVMKSIFNEFKDHKIFLDCDLEENRVQLTNVSLSQLKIMLGNAVLLCIDEAQRVHNIGLTLKILVDNFPNLQVIATGSSAFEMANDIKEPLTGRKFEFLMLPFSTQELWNHTSGFAENAALETRLIYGYYPDVVNFPEEARARIEELASSYLYKDIFEFEEIRSSGLINNLLKALAYQVGSQVSYNELALITKSSPKTVERYMRLLEQCFVVFRLHSFSRNLRNELSKSFKVYFYDNGIRNALISAFNPIGLRDDVGKLWENYLVSERLKYLHNQQLKRSNYFWRTTQQQEIDYIEEYDNQLFAYEFKLQNANKAKLTKTFANAYPNHTFKAIDKENYWEFVM
jgi:uncharacterized protein